VLKVLLDTNQLVSSLLSARGPQGQLIDAWRRRSFALLMTPGQLDGDHRGPESTKNRAEVFGRTHRPEGLLELLRSEAILLPDERPPGICRDPDDDYLLGSAAAGGVDYLVTGGADLLSIARYRGVSIVDARQFLGLLSP